jgi:hypothetical protein
MGIMPCGLYAEFEILFPEYLSCVKKKESTSPWVDVGGGCGCVKCVKRGERERERERAKMCI